MIKFQKNNAKILIPIIIFLIGTLCFLYTKFSETSDDTYNINKDFIMYGTNDEQNISSDNNFINNPEKSKIVIHIMGEVIYEGVVEIEEGARIIDAVNKAGGFTEDADTSKINLAYVLKDGQKVVIPSRYDIEQQDELVSSDSGYGVIDEENVGSENGKLVNLNTATKQELQTLPGIGESTAQKIINYREENGKFSDIEDIKNVSGIGDSKFNSIKDMITV